MSKQDEDARFQLLESASTSFINASNWFGAAKVIEQVPELLDEGIPEFVQLAAEDLFAEGTEPEGHAYEQCAAVLKRCQEVGIIQAIQEMEGVRKRRISPGVFAAKTAKPNDPALTAFLEADGVKAMEILVEHPEIVSQESIDRIEDYITHFRSLGDEISVRSLEARRDLLRRW